MWRNRLQAGAIGLIAGQGEFPVIFAKAAMSVRRPVTVFGIEGCTDRGVEEFSSEVNYLGLGELGRLVELLKQKKIKQVVFAGGIPKKKLYDPTFQMDSTAKSFIGGTYNKGDDHLLRAFELFLKVKCGVSVLDCRLILKETLASRGILTKRKPTEREKKDLRLGLKVARHVGKMDIGQTVVIKDGVVLAVEALEGTDEAIRRGGSLGRDGVVVVKVSKPGQSLRFDLPCVGPETLSVLETLSSRVLGVEADKTILISREKLIESADSQKMTIVGL